MTSASDNSEPRSAPASQQSYTCPGELYSIPRSIHLARLAAYYPNCRDCPHRFDTGHVLPQANELPRENSRRAVRTSLLTDESVRGVYLNELDRNRAIAWGEAIASVLWDEQPMMARQKPPDTSQIIPDRKTGPRVVARVPNVVVGFDERSSSPEIVTGLVLGLRRMGCPVIDLAQTSLPIVAFQVHALQAMSGVFVTGAGCDPSWTGFELFSRGAAPFSRAQLEQMEHAVKQGVGRQTRQIGSHQPYRGNPEYEASLEPFFHALRPLKIVCGSSTRLLPRILNSLFEKLPCELTHVPLATRRRDLIDVQDVDLQRVATTVLDSHHHLGVVIDEDHRHAAFITDRGRLVRPREVARLLIEIAQRETTTAKFVAATSWLPEIHNWLQGREATAGDGGESAFSLVHSLVESKASLALSGDGRVWFGQSYPACDAILLLAYVLRALSLSDTPFSEVVSRLEA